MWNYADISDQVPLAGLLCAGKPTGMFEYDFIISITLQIMAKKCLIQTHVAHRTFKPED